ncbi:MAG: hypothetical protein WCJ39_00480 [bacterium]
MSIKPSAKVNIADLQGMKLNNLVDFLDDYQAHAIKDQVLTNRILHPLSDRAKTILELGLGYISLNRGMDTLS